MNIPIPLSLRAATVALTLGFAAMLSGCGDKCEDLSCSCEALSDCPSNYTCYSKTCYPYGQYPMGAWCNNKAQCASALACAVNIGVCTTACTNGCPQGWSCHSDGNADQCLSNHSLQVGAGCNTSALCAPPATCIQNTCEVACTNGYSVAQCPDGSYCFVDPNPICKPPLPACDPTVTPTTCPDPRICVDLGEGLGICRRPCSYSVTAAGAYGDDCPAQVGLYAATCAPVGAVDMSACIEAASAGGGTGAACNGGTALCAVGYVCEGGQCRALCSTQSSCDALTCTQIAPGFSACMP